MKKILLYITISLALLYVIRELEYVGIRKNKNGEFAKLRIAFEEKNNFNLVFIGSSRAECEFFPPIIDTATGLNSFNLGMTGANLPLIKTSLEAYLLNSSAPKYIVLNLDLHSFYDAPDTIFHFPRYLAYLDNEKLVDGLQNIDHRFYFFKYLAPYSMPYFSMNYFNASLRGWFDLPGKYDAGYVNGFAPSEKDVVHGDLDTMKIADYYSVPKPFVWENIDTIENICAKNNTQLFFVVAPIYLRLEEHVKNYAALILQFRNYALDHNIIFMDLSHDEIQNHPEFYSDIAHLNAFGAQIFSQHFSSQFKQYLSP